MFERYGSEIEGRRGMLRDFVCSASSGLGCAVFVFGLVIFKAEPSHAKRSQKHLSSYVMLLDKAWPAMRDFRKSIAQRVPQFVPLSDAVMGRMAPGFADMREATRKYLKAPKDEFQWDILLGKIDDRLVKIIFVGAPNPLSKDERFFKAAWWWRSAYKDLAVRKSHVSISLPASKDARRDQLLLGKLTAGVIADTNALGVIWETANAVNRADRFASQMAKAKKLMPVSLAVSVRLGHDKDFPEKRGKPAWLAVTNGLTSMGLKELETRGYYGKPQDLLNLFWNVSSYLMRKGDVIKDNHTIGSETERQFVFNELPSSLGTGGRVLRMKVVPRPVRPEPGAIVRPKDIVK